MAVRCRNAARRRGSTVKMAAPLATRNLRFLCDSPSSITHNINTKYVSFFRLVETYRYKIRRYRTPPTCFGPFRPPSGKYSAKKNTLMASYVIHCKNTVQIEILKW